uniref:Uncharacterized protein n=1 Tax=Triticum urartu TaxID=4572 RepID=A0A8R7U8T6_TRIUA
MRRAPISSTTADASSSSELTLYAPSAGAGRGSQTQRAACIDLERRNRHVQNNTLQGTAARRRAVAATCSAASMTLMNLL